MGDLKLESGEVEIFRAGDYPQGQFTEADLAQIAADYDPENEHQAFLGFEHKKGGRAYGWFDKVRAVGNTLVGHLAHYAEDVKRKWDAGEYRKWSAEIYEDYRGTGKKYLHSVKLLGATAPQIKGLKQAAFHEEFGPIASFEVVSAEPPAYVPIDLAALNDLTPDQKRAEISRLSGELATLTAEESSNAFHEGDPTVTDTKKKDDTPPAPREPDEGKAGDPAQLAKFEERVAKLEQDLAAEREKRTTTESTLEGERRARRAERVARFAEEQIHERRISPAQRDKGLTEFCEAIHGVEFQVGDVKRNALGWFEEFVKTAPKPVPLGRDTRFDGQGSGGGTTVKGANGTTHEVRRPAGASRDTAKFADQAAQIAKAENISYEDALVRASRGTDLYGPSADEEE